MDNKIEIRLARLEEKVNLMHEDIKKLEKEIKHLQEQMALRNSKYTEQYTASATEIRWLKRLVLVFISMNVTLLMSLIAVLYRLGG